MNYTFNDRAEILVTADVLKSILRGGQVDTSERVVVGLKGQTWSFSVCLRNDEEDYNTNGFVVYINASRGDVSGTVRINFGLQMEKKFDIWFDGNHYNRCDNAITIVDLRENDLIEVDVTFEDMGNKMTYCSTAPTITDFTADSGHYPPDVQIIVDDKTIDAHRYLLSMVSTVFDAKLNNAKNCSKINTLKITDFDFDTVKVAIDYCYGIRVALGIRYISVLRFAQKYGIKQIIENVEPLFQRAFYELFDEDDDDDYDKYYAYRFHFSDFGSIAEYAWEFGKETWKQGSLCIYRKKAEAIGLTKNFANMDSETLVNIVREACSTQDEEIDDDQFMRQTFSADYDDIYDHYGPKTLTIYDLFNKPDYYKADTQFVIGDKTIDVHRHILCLISPVFQKAFSHDTKEAKTGKYEIVDFEFETVKNVIDYCYGCKLSNMTMSKFVDMLVFAEKYDIRVLINEIKPHLGKELAESTFCSIATYAWDFDDTDVKAKCIEFYRANIGELATMPDFGKLNSTTIVDIIRGAAAAAESAELDRKVQKNYPAAAVPDDGW